MNISSLLDLPMVGMLLLKWTALLIVAWTAHAFLAKRHARCRVILWRSVLCFVLAIPILQVHPVYKIPVVESAMIAPDFIEAKPVPPAAATAVQAIQKAPAPASPAPATSSGVQAISLPGLQSTQPVSWQPILLLVWFLGFICGVVRLMQSQWKLSQLRKASLPAGSSLQEQLQAVQARLGVRRKVDIRISNSTHSPFVCGLFRAEILVPAPLANTLSQTELSALLGHEIAHLRHNDLFWYIGWRWIQAIFWFHPLVWKIPETHNLACEQEADRIASSEFEGRIFYAQALAELALRVIAIRNPVENRLALNGTSQIARRLRHLTDSAGGIWSRKRSVAAFGLASALFLATVGWGYSKVKVLDPKLSDPAATGELVVKVTDLHGNPIEGATIKPYAYRVKGPRRADHRGWRSPRPSFTTDREGKANLTYNVVADPEEKLLTGQVSFIVSHPEFAPGTGHMGVDEKNEPIRLTRGIPLKVSGYVGKDRQRVPEIVAFLGNDPKPTAEEWLKKEPGVLAFNRLSPGGRMVQLMGRLPSGEIVYSEAHAFVAQTGESYRFDLEMKPGIRLEGRIDDKVPRPVTNGRAVITVRPKEFPASAVPEELGEIQDKYGNFHLWTSYRPIAEDGTFTFESIPFGGVDIVVHGDGFVSKNGAIPQNRSDSGLRAGLVIGVPQHFPLMAPATKIEVVTEPTATLEVTAKTKSGEPIKGATAYVNPNLIRIRAGLFGQVRGSDEEPFRKVSALPPIRYSGETDENGKVLLANLPAITRGLTVHHSDYEVPLSEKYATRNIRLKLQSGETEKVDLTLQPKGKEFIGTVD